ncbi:DnaB-like helicase C-terminal domain-containing protein (plasmid) [Nocardia sp. CA-129566]|uniref:DnaB-like helicase C-terminal domain-containing protein n=1 Tax=Nocardia sp. CA-129566 TaxID=3239976 RepID=UPI003D9931DF
MPDSTETPAAGSQIGDDFSENEDQAPVDDDENVGVAAGFEEADGSFIEELFQPMMDNVDAVASGKSIGVPTGFAMLDEITNGLGPGSLTVVAGHPGVGSSTLALDFARHAAIKHGIPAAYVVLDNTPVAVTQRVISAEAKIKHYDLQTGRMTDDDWTKLARRMTQVSEAPLAITRPKDRDIASVTSFLGKLTEMYGMRLIVIDSLHLLTARQDMSYENREREVGEITRRLKAFALDTNTVVVTTAQLSTNPGPRQPFPVAMSLADLRDSGTIAHIADYVILLDRPDAWERDHPRGGEADLHLAKNRHGPTAIFTVAHQLHLSRFADMARG